MKCVKCGFELPSTAKFCRSCGTPKPVTPVQSVPAPPESSLPSETARLKCKNCGLDVATTAKFCKSCGTEQSVQEASSNASPTVASMPPTAEPPQPASVAVQASRPTVHATKSKVGMYAVIAALLIVGATGDWASSAISFFVQTVGQAATQLVNERQQKTEEGQSLNGAEERQRVEGAAASALTAASMPLADEKDQAVTKLEAESVNRATEEAAQRQAAAEKDQRQPVEQPQSNALLDQATQCKSVPDCVKVMLDAAEPRQSEAIQTAATRLSEFNKVKRGDRRGARELNRRGLEQFTNANVTDAVELLRRAAAADPSDVEIASNLGYLLLQANKIDDAASALVNALMLDSRRTSSWIPIAEFFGVKSDNSSAIRALLLAYEFSANKEKTMIFFEDKAINAERVLMRPIYATAMQQLKQ